MSLSELLSKLGLPPVGGGPPPAGAALLLVGECRRTRRQVEGPLSEAISRYLGVSVVELARVDSFFKMLVETAHCEPLTLCHGINCSLNGANDLYARLGDALEGCGALPESVEVFCLAHCEHGPTIKSGSHVFCSGLQRVVVESRSWLRDDSGPVRIEDDSVPIRD